MKFTGLSPEVVTAAYRLRQYPGVTVTATKTTATLTGTVNDILNAARQSFLDTEFDNDRPAYRLLLLVSEQADAALKAAPTFFRRLPIGATFRLASDEPEGNYVYVKISDRRCRAVRSGYEYDAPLSDQVVEVLI